MICLVVSPGLIPVVSLVHLLRNLGEPLTRSDVDNLLQEVRFTDSLAALTRVVADCSLRRRSRLCCLSRCLSLRAQIYIDGDNKVNIKDLVQHMFRTSAPNPE
jgi:hypothetical protein